MYDIVLLDSNRKEHLMFDTPKQIIVSLKGPDTKQSGSTIYVCAREDDGSRLMFPDYSELISVGRECFGTTSSGKHRFRKEIFRGDRSIEFTVVGKVDPNAIQAFVNQIVAYRSITPPEFDFLSWSSYGNGSDRYLSSFTKWRIGTKEILSPRLFPSIERVREICANFCTPNVLISLPAFTKTEDLSNHVMLEFADPQPALVIDKIAYHVAMESVIPN